MVVANHELRHEEQNANSQLSEYNDMEFKLASCHAIDSNIRDYADNHDNDSIEIDATAYSW